MPFTKPNKGSVLVFSLIVLSIVLSVALSVAVVNVSNRKSAGSTGQSVQSFQVADSGVEKALKEIYKGSYTDLSTMRASITGSTACSNGSFSFPVSGGTSTVTFFDTDNAVIGCTESDWRNLVAKIKVEGTSAGTTRVIETAVAAPGLACVKRKAATSTVGPCGTTSTVNCIAGEVAVSGGMEDGSNNALQNSFPVMTGALPTGWGISTVDPGNCGSPNINGRAIVVCCK